jgi:hypothetical protein
VRSGPLRADHSYHASTKFEYTPTLGTLPRKYSTNTAALNNTTKDIGNRSIRSRSVSTTDKLSDNLSNIRLNGVDSVKASPRPNDSDDSLYGGRESRKDRHDQNLNDVNSRVGSRVSRISNGSVSNEDILFSSRGRDSTGRTTTLPRDNDNRRKDTLNDIGGTKSLSRQSSSSSISTVSIQEQFSLKQFFKCII